LLADTCGGLHSLKDIASRAIEYRRDTTGLEVIYKAIAGSSVVRIEKVVQVVEAAVVELEPVKAATGSCRDGRTEISSVAV